MNKEKLAYVIVLVNFNGFNDTKECIDSIKTYAKDLPFIVIVDNASKKTSLLNQIDYPKLKIICNQENVGFGRANNIGVNWVLENIFFDYLLLLNNDTLITEDVFEKLVPPFIKDSKIGITTCKTFYESKRDYIWYGGASFNKIKGFPEINDFNSKPTSHGADKSKYVTFVSGCCMMFSKKSIESLKGFDDDIFMYCEDLELSLRASKNQIKMYYTANTFIYHKVQGSIVKNRDSNIFSGVDPSNPAAMFVYRNMRSNQYYIMRKHLSNFDFLLFTFYFFVRLIKINFQMLRKKQFGILKETFVVLENIIRNRTSKN